MKMHKISRFTAALMAGVLIAFTPSLRAEDQPEKPNRPERPEGGPRGGQRGEMLKEIGEKLDLTADQKSKLQEAVKAQREAMKDLSPEERRAKMKETRDTMNGKIKEILTADQYAKWEKIREENRPGGPNGPRKTRGPGTPDGEKPAKQ